jgi:hypothetical protein
MALRVPLKKKRVKKRTFDPDLAFANLGQLGIQIAEPVTSEPISFPQSVEFTDAEAPVLVPTVPAQAVQRTRFRPNLRVTIRRKLSEKRKALKAELRQCERDCKSMCNKKLKKTKKRTQKKKKCNAKKSKK